MVSYSRRVGAANLQPRNPSGLVAGRRGRRVRLRHSARRRVPAAGRGSRGATSSITAAIALLHQWCGAAAPVVGVGLVGLFPSGRPERAYERVVIWAVALAGFLLPLIGAASLADISPDGGPSGDLTPVLYRALYNAGIAAQLYLSESSVEKHVNAIFAKLGLSAEQLSHRRGHRGADVPARRGPARRGPAWLGKHRVP